MKFWNGFIRRFACLKERVPTVDKESACRQEADNREDMFALAVYGDTQRSTCKYRDWTPSSSNFARILQVHEAGA